jgi:hypothetical protein
MMQPMTRKQSVLFTNGLQDLQKGRIQTDVVAAFGHGVSNIL